MKKNTVNDAINFLFIHNKWMPIGILFLLCFFRFWLVAISKKPWFNRILLKINILIRIVKFISIFWFFICCESFFSCVFGLNEYKKVFSMEFSAESVVWKPSQCPRFRPVFKIKKKNEKKFFFDNEIRYQILYIVC